MRMTLSFSLLKASPQVLLGLKYFDKFFHIFVMEKGVGLLLKHAAFENGHT